MVFTAEVGLSSLLGIIMSFVKRFVKGDVPDNERRYTTLVGTRLTGLGT